MKTNADYLLDDFVLTFYNVSHTDKPKIEIRNKYRFNKIVDDDIKKKILNNKVFVLASH